LGTELVKQTIAEVEALTGARVRVVSGIADYTNKEYIQSGRIAPIERTLKELGFNVSTTWNEGLNRWEIVGSK
jgi:hypothetical protein